MNNQPYFRYSHLDDIDRHRAGESLDLLKEALRKLDLLCEEEAVAALAAYIRSRTAAETQYRLLIETNVGCVDDVGDLLDRIEFFLDPDSLATDRPLRLQAVVGGLVKASGATVSSQGLYDPSRHAPGDAHVPDHERPRWVAEVKSRPFSQEEAHAFIERVYEYGGIGAALIVAIDAGHKPIRRDVLGTLALDYGLLALVSESVGEVVSFLVGHPNAEIPAVRQVSEAVASQLRHMRASGETINEWTQLFPA